MKSHIDLATNVVFKTLSNLDGYLKNQYKNVQPYQSVKVPDDEIVSNWISYPQEVKQKLQQENPQAYQQHEQKVNEIIARQTK